MESKELHACDSCGVVIPKEPNRSWPQYRLKRFCSRECSAANQSRKVAAICSACGAEMLRSPSHVRGVVFCSHACRQDVRSYECAQCGTSFSRRPSERSLSMVYCGRACAGLAKRKRGGQTQGRRSPEDLAWKAAVFAREGRVCRDCGSTRRLEVHHPKPVKTHPELRHDVSNGVVLCHDCHYYGVHQGMPNFIHGRYSKKLSRTPS